MNLVDKRLTDLESRLSRVEDKIESGLKVGCVKFDKIIIDDVEPSPECEHGEPNDGSCPKCDIRRDPSVPMVSIPRDVAEEWVEFNTTYGVPEISSLHPGKKLYNAIRSALGKPEQGGEP